MPTLHGTKITLRPFRASDADIVYNSLDNEETNRLTGSHGIENLTREQVEKYVANFATDDSRVGWVIADKNSETLEPLGEVIILDIDTDNRSAALRIAMFGMDNVGKGFGTEAMQLAVKHGFTDLQLHRIELDVFAFNPRAIHVYEKIGFVREGVARDALYWDGEYVDSINMAILDHEWRALQED